MKVSGVVLSLVLIIAALCCQVHASPGKYPWSFHPYHPGRYGECSLIYGPSTPTTCCFEFTTRKIPLKLVVSYEITSSRCAKEAVIFVTRRGFQICTNPKEQWVQDIRNHLDKKNAKTQSP
uniref:C-C motif chemokine n=1 Tax=Vombatus ursinus TaxID=29139 RepID=A0A4X2M0N3_VOMUR